MAISSYPLYPRPLPPTGVPDMSALITGELHDGQTDYSGASEMRSAFPAATLQTFQGYGHCLGGALGHLTKDTWPAYECLGNVYTYFGTGELPPDGFVCKLVDKMDFGIAEVNKELKEGGESDRLKVLAFSN